MFWHRFKKSLLRAATGLMEKFGPAPAVVVALSRRFTAREQTVRTDWSFGSGEAVGRIARWRVKIVRAELGEGLRALRLVPEDSDQPGFSCYDLAVQERLGQALDLLKTARDWTPDCPLAVLNPFGTGSNGLYLWFPSDFPTRVSYRVETPGFPDFSAQAAEYSGEDYTTEHEFLLIGLVPGRTSRVTLTLTGQWGNVRRTVSFPVRMPAAESGYPVRLEYTDGPSPAPETGGLFAMMRVNGYLGYGFFYDNDGVLRYEQILEGYGMDRILFEGRRMRTCISSGRLAELDGLGRVTGVWDLGKYRLHHDIAAGQPGEILALAECPEEGSVEDRLISVDTRTGQVRELVDFRELMKPYYELTRPVEAGDDFFWQVGERDWIHLNSLVWEPEEDSVIVSSRETSTVIKVLHLHTQPEVDWLMGDRRFWKDTAYAGKCLEPEGEFSPPYGQHCVELWPGRSEPGVKYLSLYDNCYWSLNSRTFSMEVDRHVGRGLYDGSASRVRLIRVDENRRTCREIRGFQVPYSSLVSNGSLCPGGENWVVNSGIANLFGEYDAAGTLIRQYAYPCSMQNYRTFKYAMELWFSGGPEPLRDRKKDRCEPVLSGPGTGGK